MTVFNLLIGYWHTRTDERGRLAQLHAQGVLPHVFLDSGAFSAMTLGAVVRREEYADWVTDHDHLLGVVANLDVIGDPEASWDNWVWLRERLGRPVLPVVHAGTGTEWLDRYLAEGERYVALGGMVGRGPTDLLPWCIDIMMHGRDATDGEVRWHGFGQTRQQMLLRLPWYSVDSTSWGAAFQFNMLPLWDRAQQRMVRIEKYNPEEVWKHADLIRSCGGDPEVFADRNQYHFLPAAEVAARSHLALQDDLRHRHGMQTAPVGWPALPDGPIIYLATGNWTVIEHLAQQLGAPQEVAK